MAHRTRYADGEPCWADVTTPDLDAAQRFYGAVFGWQFQGSGPEFGNYTMALKGGRTVAGTGLLRALPRPGWAITALLWRTMSGFYGRFTAADLRTLLESAGLRVVKLDEALDGLGLLAVAERPA